MTVILLCRCPSPLEKVKVLKDMIFPNCEKLGQTIIFVRMRDTSRQLHKQLEEMGFKITSIQVRQCVHTGCGVGCGVWCIFCPAGDNSTLLCAGWCSCTCSDIEDICVPCKQGQGGIPLIFGHQLCFSVCVSCVSVSQGDMDHASRDRVVNEFRRGETKILIATDVLARGFDVSQVSGLQLFGG